MSALLILTILLLSSLLAGIYFTMPEALMEPSTEPAEIPDFDKVFEDEFGEDKDDYSPYK
jgi:hypothetical protein